MEKNAGPLLCALLPMAEPVVAPGCEGFITRYYYRGLDLNDAVATVRFKIGDVTYQRKLLSVIRPKVLMMRITADKKGMINGTLGLTSKLKYQVKTTAANYLVLQGKAPNS